MKNTFSTDALIGRTAVVTGASGGLGGEIVAQLAYMGANVVLVDLRLPEIPTTGDHQALACDISSETEVIAAALAVKQKYGRCDILVNNAAILPKPAGLLETTESDWSKVIDVNLKGSFLCSKHFGQYMVAAGFGSIVNIASIAASAPNSIAAYCPSKAAILGLTLQTAVEWGPKGVRVNSVSPGLVRTPMSEAFYANPANLAARTSVIPSRRIGVPQDIASVVAFLVSDAASYVNGQEIIVDGGFLRSSLMNIQSRD